MSGPITGQSTRQSAPSLFDKLNATHTTAGEPTAYTPATPIVQPPTNDDVLFVGMNPDSRHEVVHLQKANPKAGFNPVFGSDEPGKITVTLQGRTLECDLTTDAGISAFVKSLQLPADQETYVAAVFRNHRKQRGALDELAQIAQVWAQAERGGTAPSRLVLSGHSNGQGVWGENNGLLTFNMLKQLAAAMPAAASQVEDLHLSACYSGGEHAMTQHREVFPNLKTIWAYNGSAPGTWSGAMPHLDRWEKATRGRTDDIDRDVVAGMRKGDNVVTWDVANGYAADPAAQTALSPADGTDPLQATQAVFDDYFTGRQPVTTTQSGPLRDRYNFIQQQLTNPSLPPERREALEGARDQTIKLIFYSASIAPRFAEAHAGALQEGYAAIGQVPPNLARLSRADALVAIADFERAVNAMPEPPKAATDLLQLLTALRDLTDGIPLEWI